MNKQDFITAVSERTGLSKKDTDATVSAVFDIIMENVAQGDKIQFIGFGTFEQKTRAARTGRNPQTGAEIKIEASKTPFFKAGKNFKEKVNK